MLNGSQTSSGNVRLKSRQQGILDLILQVDRVSRVLTKDTSELVCIGGVGFGVLQVVQQAQGQVHHGAALGDHLGPAPEAGQVVPDVAVVLLDGKGQVLAGEQLAGRDDAVIAFPIVGGEPLAG